MPVYTHSVVAAPRVISRESAEAVLPSILQFVQPMSVVDVGCGAGTWLAAFRSYGIEDLRGVDGHYVQPDDLEIPPTQFTPHDLTKPLDLGRRFDLALCLEVAEHLPERNAAGLIEMLVSLAPVVLFSAAIPGQGGFEHLNEQWPSYWARRFATHDFVAVDCLRFRLWNDSRIAWWYRQNLLFFADRNWLANSDTPLAAVERHGDEVLSAVHPELYQRDLQLLQYYVGGRSIRAILGELRRAMWRKLRP